MSQDTANATAIAITAMGLASSLGGTISACAATRAGLVRPKPLSFEVGTEHEIEPQQVIGYPCPGLDGFEGYARLGFLLKEAVADLFESANPPVFNTDELRALINIPDEFSRPLLLDYLEDYAANGLTKTNGAAFLETAIPLLDWPLTSANTLTFEDGHAGFIGLIEQALSLLLTGEIKCCLVAGVDSYMDLPSQEWLFGMELLKTANRNVGLMPGEGAAVLLLERVADAKARGATILATIGPAKTGAEEYSLLDEETVFKGSVSSRILAETLEANPAKDSAIGTLYHDLNGTHARAKELGFILPRLGYNFPSMLERSTITSAESFGDLGAASAGFSIALAIRAFARNYAYGDEALIFGASLEGQRGALILKR